MAAVPPDAALVVRVRDAAGLRKDPSFGAAQAALGRFAGDRMLSMAWGAMANQMATEPAAMFDAVLGTDATYAERTRDGQLEWAVLTRLEQPTYDSLVEHLKPAMLGGGKVAFAPQGLVAAWRAPYLVVGSKDHAGLWEEMLARVEGAAPSLADAEEVKHAAAWPAGRIEVVARTAKDGVVTASATLQDGALMVRHSSHWPKPLLHVAPGAAADVGLLAPFAQDSLAVFAMNPWRGALDPAEPVDALLLEGRMDDAMRTNMGARQLLVVADRVLEGSRLRAPSLGLAFEVRDAVLAEKQWDAWAQRLTEQLAARAKLPAPPAPALQPGKPRAAQAEALFRGVFADHPLARGMDVCWMTLSTPNGAWQLLATDPALLERLSSRIGGAVRTPAPGDWHEVGAVRGGAIAAHLRSWTSEAAAFLPEAPEAFVTGVNLAAELASVAEQLEWRARAPDDTHIEGEVVLRLRPAAAPPAAPPATPPPAAPPATPPAAAPPANTPPPATPPAKAGL